jgi:hypothetical protein
VVGPGVATGLNATETIVGYATIPPKGEHVAPVIWIAGQRRILDTLGDGQGYANAINTHGEILGSTRLATGHMHATVWALDGTLIDLGAATPTGESYGNALNDTGTVVGITTAPGYRGFWWSAATGMVLLPSLPTHFATSAKGVNNQNIIVGWSQVGGPCCPPSTAVRWVDGVVEDLNSLIDAPGWRLDQANAINDAGHIIGAGLFQGQRRAFLLLPIPPPEPPPAGPDCVQQVTGDFDHDGEEDQAGLTAEGELWVRLGNTPWHQILAAPLRQIAAGDFEGRGYEQFAVLDMDAYIYLMEDVHAEQWRWVPGQLKEMVAVHGWDGREHLAGIDAMKNIWLSPRLGEWIIIPGQLDQIVSGDFTGANYSQLAGIGTYGTIWYTPDLWSWSQLPGLLQTIETVPGTPDAMAGIGLDGLRWEAKMLGHWQRMP